MKSAKPFSTLLTLTLLLANVAPAALAQTRTGARPRPAASPAGKPAPAQAAKPAAPAPETANDIKVRTRTMAGGGHTFEDTQYIKGARERREMNTGGASFVSVMQCDMRRQVQINEQAKTYMVHQLEAEAQAGGATTTNPAADAPARRGGVVTITNASTDTGERKQMFGHTARRIKTVTTIESSPDSCDQSKMRTETDGWYIDIKYGLECRNLRAAPVTNPVTNGGRCLDQYRYKTAGTVTPGFPVDITVTSYGPDGASTTMRREVVELSRETLDASLFEVPAGYTEAKDFQQFSGMGAGRAQAADEDGEGQEEPEEQQQSPSPQPRPTNEARPAESTSPVRKGLKKIFGRP